MNNLKKIVFILLTCITIGIIASSCKSGTEKGSIAGDAGGSVELKLNFKPGDKYLYSTQINQKISYTANMSMDQAMLMEMVYTYSGDEGGNKKLDITYDHIKIDMMSPMGQMTYDSKNAQKNDNGMGIMDSLIGKSFSISVAPNGDIIKVAGMSELINSLSRATDKDSRKEVAEQFNDTAVKLMMQNSFDIYPGHPVKVGETWRKKSQMGFSVIKVDVENTYTLNAVTGDKATIGVTSVMSLPKTDMGGTAAGMKMEMTGKQEGTMEVAITTGQIISGKTTQTINGTIAAMGQNMPMNIKGDIVINSKKQ